MADNIQVSKHPWIKWVASLIVTSPFILNFIWVLLHPMPGRPTPTISDWVAAMMLLSVLYLLPLVGFMFAEYFEAKG